MKKNAIIYFCLFIIIPTISCVREVNLPVPFTNQGISISGGIIHYLNISDTVQYISITKTVPYTQTALSPNDYITNAIVKVTNGIDTFHFNYNNHFRAYLCNTNISKIPYNKIYTILIDYDGNHYEGKDSMPSPTPIDTLYITERKNIFGTSYSPRKYVARLQYTTPNYLCYYYWYCIYNKISNNGLDTLSYNPNENNHNILNDNTLYMFGKRDSVNLSSRDIPSSLGDTIFYVQGTQYRISQNLYIYQLVLEAGLQKGGPVNSPTPPNVQSNVRCTTDPSKLVFGYFMAASADVKTVFATSKEAFLNIP